MLFWEACGVPEPSGGVSERWGICKRWGTYERKFPHVLYLCLRLRFFGSSWPLREGPMCVHCTQKSGPHLLSAVVVSLCKPLHGL